MSTVSTPLYETLTLMNSAELGRRLEEIRTKWCTPEFPRQLLGERLGYRGQSAYQLIWRWEQGRAEIPAWAIPAIAENLKVTICDLYEMDCKEPPGSPHPIADRADKIYEAILGDIDSVEKEFIAELAQTVARYRKKMNSAPGGPAGLPRPK